MGQKALKTALDEYLKGTDFIEINNTISIEEAWKKTVGKLISNNTKIKSFKKGTIIIKVSNPIWRNEISLQKQEILEKLKKKEKDLYIKEIQLK